MDIWDSNRDKIDEITRIYILIIIRKKSSHPDYKKRKIRNDFPFFVFMNLEYRTYAF